MAYFSNSSEGFALDGQCEKCKYGKGPCPIFAAQVMYNYDAVNNEVATKILDSLISDDGVCSMWKQYRHDFEIDPNQLELFD
jgi:hypothetical protein